MTWNRSNPVVASSVVGKLLSEDFILDASFHDIFSRLKSRIKKQKEKNKFPVRIDHSFFYSPWSKGEFFKRGVGRNGGKAQSGQVTWHAGRG